MIGIGVIGYGYWGPNLARNFAERPDAAVRVVCDLREPRLETVRRMNLLFGVRATHAEEWTSLRRLLDECARLAREAGMASSGDLVAVTAGLPAQELGTNLFEIHRVP